MQLGKRTDLHNQVSSPPEVAMILRTAAECYAESAMELGITWQDQHCGRVWNRLARVLDAAAERCDKICKEEGWK